LVNKDYEELPLPPDVDVHVFVQVASEMCLPGRKSISSKRTDAEQLLARWA
jgi:hypothetical protein